LALWGAKQERVRMWSLPEALLRPNGLELSCPAAQALPRSFSRIMAGLSPSNFPHASRVSCSELLGGEENRASDGYDQEREMLAPAIMILAVQGK
jgi:hypothetical protein